MAVPKYPAIRSLPGDRERQSMDRERERERVTKRKREREREKERQRDRVGERERERERRRERQRDGSGGETCWMYNGCSLMDDQVDQVPSYQSLVFFFLLSVPLSYPLF